MKYCRCVTKPSNQPYFYVFNVFLKYILYSEKCKRLCKLLFEMAVIPAAKKFDIEFRECSESWSERGLGVSTGMWS